MKLKVLVQVMKRSILHFFEAWPRRRRLVNTSDALQPCHKNVLPQRHSQIIGGTWSRMPAAVGIHINIRTKRPLTQNGRYFGVGEKTF